MHQSSEEMRPVRLVYYLGIRAGSTMYYPYVNPAPKRSLFNQFPPSL